MRILSVGSLSGVSNTCRQRSWALRQVADCVDEINTTSRPWSFFCRLRFFLFQKGLPIPISENDGENEKICQLITKNRYDIVWIDKGQTIFPKTLQYIKKQSPETKIVSYSPDNMALRHNQTQQYLDCLPLYDLVITNKSYILDDMRALGVKQIVFHNNCYAAEFHYPRPLSELDFQRYGGDVVFVGAWEADRCKSILYLADHHVSVKVFGDGNWSKYQHYSTFLTIENMKLMGEEYCKTLQAHKISLCFLRKMNQDQQTTRSVEIPACGGFMLAERTVEHQTMFEEGKEAAYFSTDEELLEKCRYYLHHEQERAMLARRGRSRCVSSEYDNSTLIKKSLAILHG